MGAIAALAIGAALVGGGTALGASGANKKIKKLEGATDRWLPNIPAYQKEYFDDLKNYTPKASALSRDVTERERNLAWDMREADLPGYRANTTDQYNALSPILKGEFAPWMKSLFSSSAGAGTVGSGFGGSRFGSLMTGFGGLDRGMAYQRHASGLLQTLMAGLPQYQGPTTSSFLSQIINPQQRVQNQLNIRGQNLGIATQVAGMNTSNDVIGQGLTSIGGMVGGAGMGSMGMGGSGGGPQSYPSFGAGYSMPSNYFGMTSGQQNQYNRSFQNANAINQSVGPGWFE